MKNVEKKHFKFECFLWLSLELLFVITTIIFINTENYIQSILFLAICVFTLFLIIIKIINYIKYINCNNILEGEIVKVECFRCYNIIIQYELEKYVAKYVFISSSIKEKIGCKCSFVLMNKGKVCIKDIN